MPTCVDPAARSEELLRALSVTHIIDASDQSIGLRLEDLEYLEVNLKDEPQEPICEHFERVCHFISGALSADQDARVLVHCSRGISRSVTLLLAFMVSAGVPHPMTAEEALEFVKQKRPRVNPNRGFWEQLCRFSR